MATTLSPTPERLSDWPVDGGRDEPAPAALAGREPTAATPATHRRRSRWFELNPGCFGHAALLAAVTAGALAAGGTTLWTLRWRRRGRRALRVVRSVRDADRGRRAER